MFNKNYGAVVTGTMSDTSQGRVNRFSRPFDNWYYLHIKQIADSGRQISDSVPLKDYLFRFNRGTFWAAEPVFAQASIPFNQLTRFLLDPMLRTSMLYQALQASEASQAYLRQDLVLPKQMVVKFLDFIDTTFEYVPDLGGCPIKAEPRSPLQCNGINTDMVYNIGVYGLRVELYEEFVRTNRLIEA